MKLVNIFFAYAVLALVLSCSKIGGVSSGSATLNLINAVNGSNPLVTNFSGVNAKGEHAAPLDYFANASVLGYGGSWESGSYTGMTNVSLSQVSDTSVAIWQGKLDLMVGTIHSLFLCGDTLHIDTVYTTDHIPFYPISDSVAGVRFVNLISACGPVSVNLQGNPPSQYEFSNIEYKRVTAFNTYNANNQSSGSYTFDIRVQSTDSLLSTFTWSYTLMRNQTIVLAGSIDALNGYPIVPFTVNNF